MKVHSSKTFGEAIRQRRKELGYTQKELSDFSGISVSFLSDLENGKPTAELEKCLHIAGLLGLDVLMNVRGK